MDVGTLKLALPSVSRERNEDLGNQCSQREVGEFHSKQNVVFMMKLQRVVVLEKRRNRNLQNGLPMFDSE